MAMKIANGYKSGNDSNDGVFDTRKFYNNEEEKLDRMRFHGVRKIFERVHDHCHYTSKYRVAAHSIWNLRYNTLNEIPIVFDNESNHDFAIKQLAGELEGQLEYLREKLRNA